MAKMWSGKKRREVVHRNVLEGGVIEEVRILYAATKGSGKARDRMVLRKLIPPPGPAAPMPGPPANPLKGALARMLWGPARDS